MRDVGGRQGEGCHRPSLPDGFMGVELVLHGEREDEGFVQCGAAVSFCSSPWRKL